MDERGDEEEGAARDGADPHGPWSLLAILFVTFAIGAITATYSKLSHTADEPMHIACGLEWWREGEHLLKPENPPLAQVCASFGPYVAGHELPGSGAPFRRGVEVLYEGDYGRTLTSARVGTMPFFVLAALVVWLWAKRLGGGRAALFAVASFVLLPPVLGHAGLATTDVPFLATFLLLLLALVRWLDAPTGARALAMGLALGLALATKFSTLFFLPPALVALAFGRWRFGSAEPEAARLTPRRLLAGAALTLVTATLVVWGVYRFSFGALIDLPGGERLVETCFPDEGVKRTLANAAAHVPAPAPEVLHGLFALLAHVQQGHSAYLFGQESEQGFRLFYPVVLGLKTPLAFMALVALGALGLLVGGGRSRPRAVVPALAAVLVLLTALPSTINIGVRHVLVVYPLLAIPLGVGVSRLLAGRGRRWAGVAVVGLLVAELGVVVGARANLLAWFNGFAGDEPGEVLLDSDLDWGQDVRQLAAFFEERDVEELRVALFGSARLCEHGLPPLRWLPPGEEVTGWVAISEMYFRDHWHLAYDDACERDRPTLCTVPDGYGWLRAHEPVARAGRSIRIYRIERP